MTKFHEIGALHGGQRSTEVLCTELPNYIGSNLVWQERVRLSRTYGEILEAYEKGDHVIVKVSKVVWLGTAEVEKFSFPRQTKVVVQLTD